MKDANPFGLLLVALIVLGVMAAAYQSSQTGRWSCYEEKTGHKIPCPPAKPIPTGR